MRILLLLLVGLVLVSGTVASSRASPWPSEQLEINRSLEEGGVEERSRAALALGGLRESQARSGLLIALRDPNAQVKLNAARSLLALDVRGLSLGLHGWLGSRVADERLLAVEVIGREPSLEDVDVLAVALSDTEPAIRAAAATGLGRSVATGRDVARRALVNSLDDPDVEVRVEVAAALGRVGDHSVSVPIAAHLADPESEVRSQLAIALGVIGDPSVVPALLVASSDRFEGVVAAVARALGSIGAPAAVPTLISLAQKTPLGDVGKAALEALAEIGNESSVRAIARHLEAPASQDFASALLLSLGEAAEPTLRTCLRTSLGRTLERCALLASMTGQPEEPVFSAYSEGRLSAEAVLKASTGLRPSLASEVLALEMLEEGGGARVAALQYLRSLGHLSSAAGPALTSALLTGGRSAEEKAEILELLVDVKAFQPKGSQEIALSYLEATDDSVSSAAARLLVARGSEGEALVALLGSHRAEVAAASAEELAKRMSVKQAATVSQLLLEQKIGRRQLLLSTLAGVPAGVSGETLLRFQTLFTDARGSDRDALLLAFARNGGEQFSKELDASFNRADFLKAAQLAAYHPQGRKRVLALLSHGEGARFLGTVLATLARVGEGADARIVTTFTSAEVGRPIFLRAAAYSALAMMLSRGLSFPFPPRLLSKEACFSTHWGLRAAALRLAAVSGLPCSGAELERILLLDRSSLARRTAAELLREYRPSSRALRECAAYEVRVSVAEVCRETIEFRPEAHRRLQEHEGSIQDRLSEVELVRRGETRLRPLTPVALRSDNGVVVLVSDRRGRFVAPPGRFDLLEPEFSY